MTPRLAALCAAACAAMAAAVPVGAQTVYRIFGPDGKVTFSDRAPDAKTAPAPLASGRSAAGAALPYELQQIVGRFPVTLYTSNDCAPCSNARDLLANRGVPFTERTVNTNEDIDALQRMSGSTTLPFGTIGSQQLSGFSDAEWTQYLDAAGYPKQSQLPAAYRRPPAAPLVAAKTAAPAPAPATGPATSTAPAPANSPPPAAPNRSNPAGIQF
nr:glutaredoxin family protein [Paracidovorax konjaci]